MSGFGAPARTDTPRPASVNGVPGPATTLPFLASPSLGSGLSVIRSAGPLLSLCSSAAPASWRTVTLCPLVRANAAASSWTPGTAPWLVRTMSSAAWHTAPDDSPMRVVPIAHDHDFIVMATSLMIKLFFFLFVFLNAGQFPHDAVALPAPRNRCRVDPTARWTRCSH